VDAVDWSVVGVTHGRQDTPPTITWTVGDAAQGEPDGPVDLALLCYPHLRVDVTAAALTRVPGWLSDRGVLLYPGHAPQVTLARPPLEQRPSFAALAHAVCGLRAPLDPVEGRGLVTPAPTSST
jgi:hypothetical protein